MAKNLKIEIKPEDITSISIYKYKDGYNCVSLGVEPSYNGKKEDLCTPKEPCNPGLEPESEYITINYEWRGSKIPDVVMDIMSFAVSEKAAIDASIEEKKADWLKYMEIRASRDDK